MQKYHMCVEHRFQKILTNKNSIHAFNSLFMCKIGKYFYSVILNQAKSFVTVI